MTIRIHRQKTTVLPIIADKYTGHLSSSIHDLKPAKKALEWHGQNVARTFKKKKKVIKWPQFQSRIVKKGRNK